MSIELSVHRVHRVARYPRSGKETYWTTLEFFGRDDKVLGEITLFHDNGIKELTWFQGTDDED